jgi:hypothetical protein
MKLQEMLLSLNNDALRPLLHFLSQKPNPLPTRKLEIVALLCAEMTDPARLRRQWNVLSKTEGAAVAAALYDGGELDTTAFIAMHGSLPSTSPGRYGRDASALSLFFDSNWRLADELIPLLKVWVPEPDPYQAVEKDALPETVAPFGQPVALEHVDTEPIAFHDLSATLLLARDGKLKVSDQTSLPGGAILRTLAGRLLLSDYYDISDGGRGAQGAEIIRPFGLIVLAQAARLVKKRGDLLFLTPAGEAWLAQPGPAQYKSMVDAWVKSDVLDELRRINLIKGQQARGIALSAPSLRRRAILNTLENCTPGKWLHVNEFFKLVKLTRNNFDVETGSFTRLYAFDQEYGWFGGLSSDTSWRVVQGQYILVVLFEYLAALGLIDVAYVPPEKARYRIDYLWGYDDSPYFSRYDGLQYIRLTALGAYVLGLADQYTPAVVENSKAVLKVLPNHQIVILHRNELKPNDRTMIERVAERVSDDVYQIAAGMLLDAFETGLTGQAVVQFLESASGGPLPQTVAVLIDDVAANSRKVERAGEAVLFRTADAHLAALLANDRELKQYCLLAGKNILVVPAAKQTAFRKRVKQMGYGAN